MTLIDAFQQSPAFYISTVFVLGLLIGSFLNVVIYRLPIMMENSWRSDSMAFLAEDDASDITPESIAEEKTENFNLIFSKLSLPSL